MPFASSFSNVLTFSRVGGPGRFTLIGAQNGMARRQTAFSKSLDRVLSWDRIALK